MRRPAHPHERSLKTPFGVTLSINGKLLIAFLLGAAAWVCWPPDKEWWQLGVLSVMLGILAVAKFFDAVRSIIKLYLREREIAAFLAQGRAAHSSELAGRDALKKAGMTDE